jgi:2-oxoglutarate ferredoxin oxidoreductase subunit alpha
MSAEAHVEMMERLIGKIRGNLKDIIHTESYRLDDAEIAIVSYGVSARSSLAAVDEARELGIKAGLLRLITVWPFPEELLRELAGRMKALVTVEVNLGQIHLEVERCAAGQAPAHLVGHAGGAVITPDQIIEMLRRIG